MRDADAVESGISAPVSGQGSASGSCGSAVMRDAGGCPDSCGSAVMRDADASECGVSGTEAETEAEAFSRTKPTTAPIVG